MKRFDIETYSKSTLKGYTLTPNKGVWEELSRKLDKKDQKKVHIKTCVKAVLYVFIGAFIYGLGLMTDSSDNRGALQYLETHQNTKIIKGLNTPITDTEVQEMVIDPRVFNSGTGNISTTKKENNPNEAKKNEAKKIVKRDDLKIVKRDDLKTVATRKLPSRKVLTGNNENFKGYSTHPKVQVTDAEIDDLLNIARKNIQKESVFGKNKETRLSAPKQGLSNSSHMDTVMNVDSRNLPFQNNIFRELMKIKYAFAN
jgi:hypothetical protein